MKHVCMHLGLPVLLVLVAGCSAYPKKVDCEGHLTPINAPAPAPAKDPVP